jgi:hypothetical protein
MTITKKYLRDWEKSARISFTGKQQQIILERFGTEPYPYEWSEQDIQVQIGNYLHCGHWEKPSIRCAPGEILPTSTEF